MPHFYSRWQQQVIKQAMGTRRVLLLSGARQCGKTTLARQLASKDTTYRTLDDLAVRQIAENDPHGFVKHPGRTLIIDEVQRVPSLLSWRARAPPIPDRSRQTHPGAGSLTRARRITSRNANPHELGPVTQTGVSDPEGLLPAVQRPLDAHRGHRSSPRRHSQDSRPSRVSHLRPPSVPGPSRRSLAGGPRPRTLPSSGAAPEPVLPLGLYHPPPRQGIAHILGRKPWQDPSRHLPPSRGKWFVKRAVPKKFLVELADLGSRNIL